jgi:hypothetical protein
VSSAFTRQVSLHTAAQRSQKLVDADGLDFLVLSIVGSLHLQHFDNHQYIDKRRNVKTCRGDPENKW